MDSSKESIVIEQLKGLEPLVPAYDYEGLTLPSRLTVNAHFGSHEHPRDLDETRAILDPHDIIVFENFGSDARTSDLIQKLSRGNYAAREKMLRQIQLRGGNKAWTEQQLTTMKAFYNIRKPLLVIDPERGHPIAEKVHKLFDIPNRFSLNFSRAVEEHKVKIVGLAEANLERENYLITSFCDQVRTQVETNPKLSAKQERDGISVLLFDFGLAHSGLYYGIQEVARRNQSEINTSVYFSPNAEVIDYIVQAMGRYVYGFKVDDLMVAKSMVSKVIINNAVSKEDETNSPVLTAAFNQTTQQVEDLDLQQLEELYSRINPIG